MYALTESFYEALREVEERCGGRADTQPEAELSKSSEVLLYENCMAKLKMAEPRLTVNSCTELPKTHVTSADALYSCANANNRIGGSKGGCSVCSCMTSMHCRHYHCP